MVGRERMRDERLPPSVGGARQAREPLDLGVDFLLGNHHRRPHDIIGGAHTRLFDKTAAHIDKLLSQVFHRLFSFA